MDDQELRSEMITIRLTPTEKRKIEEAGRAKFKLNLGTATFAREILMNAVDLILARLKRKTRE
jgi:hypothetical protein